jgi:hypothetical protein
MNSLPRGAVTMIRSDAKLRGRVPTAIRKGFAENAEEFFFMNRGLVIAAEKVEYRETGGKKMDLVMRDPSVHGLLDGGHTYRVVTDAVRDLAEDDPPVTSG